MLAKFCQWLCDKYPERVRIIPRDGKPYLLRFYITTPRTAEDSDKEIPERFGIYLHHFFAGDVDKDLHNHPWAWALSLMLSGAYYEERLRHQEYTIYPIVRIAGDFNFMTQNDFHRVELLPGYNDAPVWTLFVTGKRVKRWGFKRRYTGEYVDQTEYLKEKS